MNNAEFKKCKKKGCDNPVLEGKYCEHCKQIRKEKRDNFLKAAGGTVMAVGSIAVTVIFRKPPNIRGK